MRILVTGGTGLVGRSVLPWLLRHGHAVRVLARHASDAVSHWGEAPGDLEAFDADVTRPESLRGAAAGMDAVLHLVGSIEESPPRNTYSELHVGGTRHVMTEAMRAGVRRFVHVSALGATAKKSAYQRSKFSAEALVREFDGAWTIVRPAGVFGPRDQVVSLLLRLVRGSPVVPLVGFGNQPVQFIWHDDLGKALLLVLEQEELAGEVLEVAGHEVTTSRELIGKLSALTKKRAYTVPVPPFAAVLGSKAAATLGFAPPLNEAKLAMLLEGSTIDPAEKNALESVLGIEATPFDEGLRRILDCLPLQLLEEGFGAIEHKLFWSDVRSSSDPHQVIERFREHSSDILPLDLHTEPGTPERIDLGTTLTMRLPGRGNIQMRAIEIEPTRLTLATVEGHPISGAVRFSAERSNGSVRCQVEIFARPSNAFDFLAIRSFGHVLQDAHWKRVAKQLSKLAGGKAHRRMGRRAEALRGDHAQAVATELRGLLDRFERETDAPWSGEPPRNLGAA